MGSGLSRAEFLQLKTSRKARQLATQAEHALRFALSELADQRVSSAVLLMVESSADASRLMILIQAAPGMSATDVEEGLAQAQGFLRASMAEAITRKRVPALVFHVMPAEATP